MHALRRTLLALAVTVTGPLLPALAHAQSAVREHDGLYARLGAGVPFAMGSAEPDGGGPKADISGVGLATELAIGGTLAPGLVLGGGMYQMIVPSPKYEFEGNESTLGAHHAGTLGPFVDYYFDPKSGLHAQAALLLSFLVVDEKDSFESETGSGFGFMAGVGYELWIGEQWSVGPLFRFTYSRLSVTGEYTEAESNVTLMAPALLASFTYH
jgi:hypothetical protein